MIREVSTDEPTGFGSRGEESKRVIWVDVENGRRRRRERVVDSPNMPAPTTRICDGGSGVCPDWEVMLANSDLVGVSPHDSR